jgi:hypothetical protein
MPIAAQRVYQGTFQRILLRSAPGALTRLKKKVIFSKSLAHALISLPVTVVMVFDGVLVLARPASHHTGFKCSDQQSSSLMDAANQTLTSSGCNSELPAFLS